MNAYTILRHFHLTTLFYLPLILGFLVCCGEPTGSSSPEDEHSFLLKRAASLELDTDYSPPPGDSMHHHASGFAKILCSAVFVTGLDAEFAAENIGYFTSPYTTRALMNGYEIDHARKEVRVTTEDGTIRVARYLGDQGCVCLPIDNPVIYFRPIEVKSQLPPPESTAWPMGDVTRIEDIPAGLDYSIVQRAVDTAFRDPEGMTAAFVVTWKGHIIGERYREGLDRHTRLESWSMGKSLTATLIGVLIQQGVYTLDQPAPIPEWQTPGDARSDIRISDILRMSSGLRFRAPQDPDYDPSQGYPDHLYVYTGSVNSFQYAANRPQQWPPNSVGRYRNSDPVLANYLIRLGAESMGEDYLSFPQKHLFDKVGVRDMVMETDPYGNFLLQGYEFGTARDWARLGNLYLNDGVINSERILPEGFVDFVSTVAPAWEADGRPIYGGFFWINTEKDFPVPKEAYYMAGAGGQYTIIIPSHDLVIVKLSHYKGAARSRIDLENALALLLRTVPESRSR